MEMRIEQSSQLTELQLKVEEWMHSITEYRTNHRNIEKKTSRPIEY